MRLEEQSALRHCSPTVKNDSLAGSCSAWRGTSTAIRS